VDECNKPNLQGELDLQDEQDLQGLQDEQGILEEHGQPDDQEESHVKVQVPVDCTESEGTHEIVIMGKSECVRMCVTEEQIAF